MQEPAATQSSQRPMSTAQPTSPLELARLFLKLGMVAFGGPPAHIAMMEDEVVSRRGWLTREQFLDFLGATNLIPGPNSTEMAIHVGRVRAGWPGLLVAGTCFILPSAIMVTALAWAYVRFGSLPQFSGVLYGVKPIVIALIVQAVFKLARSAVKSKWLAIVGALAVVATALGADQLAVLAAGGLLTGLMYWLRQGRRAPLPAPAILTGGTAIAAGSTLIVPVNMTALFLVFLKIGAILFGGGYVLVALIRSNLVTRLGWISERQLLDAIAMGQVTPGPLSTTATFIGYLLKGTPGALIATVAIFLPAFFFVAISGPLVPRLRQSPLAGAVLDGVNVAALALIAVATWQLFRAAVVDGTTLVLAALSFFLLIAYRMNSLWLILAGATIGAAATRFHR
ncbi:MAG TPA: chromate efflux transporter [Terriglobales bacterium]|jgi:chromate transporter|nr:chromate efflux transporter [Terriglobales bacterium]